MYSSAIPGAPNDDEAEDLYRLSNRLLLPYSVAGTGVFEIFRQWKFLGFDTFPVWSGALVLVSLTATASFTNVRFYLVRLHSFGLVGRAVIAQNATRAVGQVVAGLLSSTWWSLTLSDVLGRFAGIAPGIRLIRGRTSRPAGSCTLRSIAKAYSAYPAVYLPSTLINNLVVWLPLPLITERYGAVAAGYYAIVTRIAGVPLGVIAASFADVFHGHLATESRRGGDVRSLFWRTSALLCLLGGALALLLAVIGPAAIEFTLGSQWGTAGEMCTYLAPWFFAQFVASPVSRIILVYNGQRIKLIFDLLGLAVVFGSYGAAVANDIPLLRFVLLLSVANSLLYCLYFWLLYIVLQRSRPGRHRAPKAGANRTPEMLENGST